MAPKETKVTPDQSSHKVIEKRRRDRINACLSELSQTVPAAFSKQTSGKLEKAEILEMTVEYLRAVQTTEIGSRFDHGEWYSSDIWADFVHHYQAGYNDCVREIVRFMTDVEGIQASDERCLRMISYLQTRFRSEASVSGGSAYRDAVQRLSSFVKSRSSSNNLPVDSPLRFFPYIIPNRGNRDNGDSSSLVSFSSLFGNNLTDNDGQSMTPVNLPNSARPFSEVERNSTIGPRYSSGFSLFRGK